MFCGGGEGGGGGAGGQGGVALARAGGTPLGELGAVLRASLPAPALPSFPPRPRPCPPSPPPALSSFFPAPPLPCPPFLPRPRSISFPPPPCPRPALHSSLAPPWARSPPAGARALGGAASGCAERWPPPSWRRPGPRCTCPAAPRPTKQGRQQSEGGHQRTGTPVGKRGPQEQTGSGGMPHAAAAAAAAHARRQCAWLHHHHHHLPTPPVPVPHLAGGEVLILGMELLRSPGHGGGGGCCRGLSCSP